jgi:hypothetical protein
LRLVPEAREDFRHHPLDMSSRRHPVRGDELIEERIVGVVEGEREVGGGVR